ncbi:MAG TPA: alpha/beta fold hydrolase [Clostridia bacterium]|nr:alpha/beta fold hydrolase [Clostridia bacterium]
MTAYKPQRIFRNAHVNTVYHSQVRNVSDLIYVRKKFELEDGDFLDLDLSFTGGKSLAVILHGLESSAGRPYMKGMAKALNDSGIDAMCVNFRGCGGEPNRLLRFYHSGDTEDVRQIIRQISNEMDYENIFMVGFSLGANVLLKFLGEEGTNAKSGYGISKAAAVSVPCDLASASKALDSSGNFIYRKRFLKKLGKTLARKKELHPDKINLSDFKKIKTLKEYDDRYTSVLHGFSDSNEYYEKASSKPYLRGISIPVLIINALDDPFLGKECYPDENEARENDYIDWIVTKFGGHVGFSSIGNGPFWHEKRICGHFTDIDGI